MLSQKELLNEYKISDEYFKDSGIGWEDLEAIYTDYEVNKYAKYRDILLDFEREYLQDIGQYGIHSIRTRIKEPKHLIEKIIRRRKENYNKYKSLSKDNYEKFLTDLIGIRCFILFKEDWEMFHSYITGCIENNEKYYVVDCIEDFDEDANHCYHAEAPKVHIRNGDDRSIYEGLLPSDNIKSSRIYRSVHYIIKYKGVYIEIQVRTLFEEGWGEIDHNIVYPYYKDDPILNEYTELLNRMSGLADEMGSFFRIVKKLELKVIDEGVPIVPSFVCESYNQYVVNSAENADKCNTPKDCVNFILEE